MSVEATTTSRGAPLPVVCALLRTKRAHVGVGAGDGDWREGASSTASFWCLATMDHAGPDDGYVHAERCRAGRACFVERLSS